MFRFCLLLSLYLVRFTHQLDCQDPVDVIFALDASVDFHQFEQMRNFIVESLGDFNVKDEIVQVAVLSYTSEVIKSRHFNSLQIEDAISQFVYALNIESGKPNVANVLATIRNDFSGTRDRRTSVPMVVVLLSGGGVDNFEQALIESTSLKGANVSIFVAVVGNAFLIPGFYLLASYPFDRNFFHTSNLQSVRANLVGKICNRKTTMCQDYCLERGECVPHDGDVTCSCFPGFFGRFCNALGCTQPVNVFFALTAASSIDIETFLNQIDFVHNVMLNLNLMESKIGFGVYYNNSLEIKLDFQRYETFKGDTKWFQQKVFDAVSSEFKMGYTNLTNVLKVIRQGIFSPGENNVLVLFVSGPSPDIVSSAREAALARNGPEVIQILVVTVGQMYSRDEVNAIAITSGVADYQGVNVFPADKFHTSLITGLVDSICNIKNECASNPCLNSGLCIDFINGYRCFCPSNRIGPHCETEGNEYIDLIFGFDSSGSIRNDEFENILKFAIKIVSQLDISPSKTRVGAVKWNSRAYDLFHLDTYTSLQDVAWAIGQITFEPLNGGTNTSDCLKLIKDVLLKPGQNGERPLARNLVLLFTDGNSNIDDEMTIPLAADLRTSRNARIITLGIGNFTNFNEMTSLCLIPPSPNKDFFIFPSFEFVSIAFDSLFETLLEVESCQDINCQNGGHCEIKRRAVCVCSRSFGGKYCEKSCNRVMDVVFVIDTSGSAQSDVVTNRTVALVREMASFFPLEATKFSVVTFGNYARINFLLRSFNNSQDLMDSLVFKMSVGPQFLGTAIGFLGNSSTVEGPHIFATRNGGRPSSAKVAVIVTSSDSPYEYRDIVQAAGKSRSMGTEIYAVLTSNWPSWELYQAIVDSPSRLFTVNSNNDLSYIAERTFTSICANTK